MSASRSPSPSPSSSSASSTNRRPTFRPPSPKEPHPDDLAAAAAEARAKAVKAAAEISAQIANSSSGRDPSPNRPPPLQSSTAAVLQEPQVTSSRQRESASPPSPTPSPPATSVTWYPNIPPPTFFQKPPPQTQLQKQQQQQQQTQQLQQHQQLQQLQQSPAAQQPPAQQPPSYSYPPSSFYLRPYPTKVQQPSPSPPEQKVQPDQLQPLQKPPKPENALLGNKRKNDPRLKDKDQSSNIELAPVPPPTPSQQDNVAKTSACTALEAKGKLHENTPAASDNVGNQNMDKGKSKLQKAQTYNEMRQKRDLEEAKKKQEIEKKALVRTESSTILEKLNMAMPKPHMGPLGSPPPMLFPSLERFARDPRRRTTAPQESPLTAKNPEKPADQLSASSPSNPGRPRDPRLERRKSQEMPKPPATATTEKQSASLIPQPLSSSTSAKAPMPFLSKPKEGLPDASNLFSNRDQQQKRLLAAKAAMSRSDDSGPKDPLDGLLVRSKATSSWKRTKCEDSQKEKEVKKIPAKSKPEVAPQTVTPTTISSASSNDKTLTKSAAMLRESSKEDSLSFSAALDNAGSVELEMIRKRAARKRRISSSDENEEERAKTKEDSPEVAEKETSSANRPVSPEDGLGADGDSKTKSQALRAAFGRKKSKSVEKEEEKLKSEDKSKPEKTDKAEKKSRRKSKAKKEKRSRKKHSKRSRDEKAKDEAGKKKVIPKSRPKIGPKSVMRARDESELSKKEQELDANLKPVVTIVKLREDDLNEDSGSSLVEQEVDAQLMRLARLRAKKKKAKPKEHWQMTMKTKAGRSRIGSEDLLDEEDSSSKAQKDSENEEQDGKGEIIVPHILKASIRTISDEQFSTEPAVTIENETIQTEEEVDDAMEVDKSEESSNDRVSEESVATAVVTGEASVPVVMNEQAIVDHVVMEEVIYEETLVMAEPEQDQDSIATKEDFYSDDISLRLSESMSTANSTMGEEEEEPPLPPASTVISDTTDQDVLFTVQRIVDISSQVDQVEEAVHAVVADAVGIVVQNEESANNMTILLVSMAGNQEQQQQLQQSEPKQQLQNQSQPQHQFQEQFSEEQPRKLVQEKQQEQEKLQQIPGQQEQPMLTQLQEKPQRICENLSEQDQDKPSKQLQQQLEEQPQPDERQQHLKEQSQEDQQQQKLQEQAQSDERHNPVSEKTQQDQHQQKLQEQPQSDERHQPLPEKPQDQQQQKLQEEPQPKGQQQQLNEEVQQHQQPQEEQAIDHLQQDAIIGQDKSSENVQNQNLLSVIVDTPSDNDSTIVIISSDELNSDSNQDANEKDLEEEDLEVVESPLAADPDPPPSQDESDPFECGSSSESAAEEGKGSKNETKDNATDNSAANTSSDFCQDLVGLMDKMTKEVQEKMNLGDDSSPSSAISLEENALDIHDVQEQPLNLARDGSAKPKELGDPPCQDKVDDDVKILEEIASVEEDDGQVVSMANICKTEKSEDRSIGKEENKMDDEEESEGEALMMEESEEEEEDLELIERVPMVPPPIQREEDYDAQDEAEDDDDDDVVLDDDDDADAPLILVKGQSESIDFCPQCKSKLDPVAGCYSLNCVTFDVSVTCVDCGRLVVIKNAFSGSMKRSIMQPQ